MSKRSRRSRRRINSIASMIFLTAMLLIASTYAWFSANKVVTINTITAKVAAAEGLQISLDGEMWSSVVTIDDTNLRAALEKDAAAAGTSVSGTSTNNLTYRLPANLTPVSASGSQNLGKLDLMYGDVSADGSSLKNVAKETDSTTDKYICFDIFLKNSSSKTGVGDDKDLLQLNVGSGVVIPTGNADASKNGQTGTGLEYSTRVGFVIFDATADFLETPATIRALSGGSTSKVAIWEPNNLPATVTEVEGEEIETAGNDQHTAEVVANDTRIATKYTQYTTYGLTTAAATSGSDAILPNINVASPDATKFKAPITLGTAEQISGSDAITLIDATSGANITLEPNKIMKVRVYIWLEGQDPDCIDTASTGRLIQFNILLTKPDANPIPASN